MVNVAVETEGDAAGDVTPEASVSTALTDVTPEGDAPKVDGDETNSDAPGEGDEPKPDDDDGSDAGNEGDDVVPETYADFNLPDGMILDEAALSEIDPIFKDLGLSQDKAQKLIDVYANQIQAGEQKQVDTFNQLMDDWLGQSKNDGEFGGEKFAENVKIAQSAISRYGTPELKQLMMDHGMGNHPEMIRFMVRVGHTLKEDVPGDSGNNSPAPRDRVSILYPKDK